MENNPFEVKKSKSKKYNQVSANIQNNIVYKNENQQNANPNLTVENRNNQNNQEQAYHDTNVGTKQVDKYYVSPQQRNQAIRGLVVLVVIFLVSGLSIWGLYSVASIFLDSGYKEEVNQLVSDDLLTYDSYNLYSQDREFVAGESVVLDGSSGYELESKIDYYGDIDIMAGVYTIEVTSPDTKFELGIIDDNSPSYVNFYMSDKVDGEVTNVLTNIVITKNSVLSVSNYSQDFELTLTPQSEYISFSDEIVPGMYTAGVTIDSGKYQVSSSDSSEEVWVMVIDNNNEMQTYDASSSASFELQDGETLIVDNEYTQITAI